MSSCTAVVRFGVRVPYMYGRGTQLLVNYGVVEDNNPYDKLTVTATIPNSDPLFKEKRAALQPAMAGLSTQQDFDLKPVGVRLPCSFPSPSPPCRPAPQRPAPPIPPLALF